MGNIEENEIDHGIFACNGCGSDLKYKPGTKNLNCAHCGSENEIPQLEGNFHELNFHEYLEKKSSSEETITENFAKCENCGASSSLENNVVSANCPYCTTPLNVENTKDEEIILPKAILPFNFDKKNAKIKFKKWINKLWFAPNQLKKATLNFDNFKGVYIPYWTYDTDTTSNYTGQRGDYYYETETYTETVDGKQETKTREVRRTRWTSVRGNIYHLFDDILVVGSTSLPEKYIYKLEPWDLNNLVPFDKSYLRGFITEKYQVNLGDGFEKAKKIIDPKIRSMIKRDIGGDQQRIISKNTNYDDITFKHLLLPVYVSAYKYNNKVYQFLVNGRTGEVQGQRPYSWIKITLAILLTVTIIACIVYMYKN